MPTDCPHCPEVFDGKYEKQAVAQHMSQKSNHPETTYTEAINTLNSQGGGDGETPSATVENGEDSESPEGVGVESEENGAESMDGETGGESLNPGGDMGANPSGENPLLRVPVTDGGEESDDAEEPTCPDCESDMERPASDAVITGTDRRGREVKVETDGDDDEWWCPRCQLFRGSADGETVVVR